MDFARFAFVGVLALLTYMGHADATGDTVPKDPNDGVEAPVAFDFFALSDDQRAAHLLEVVRQLDLAAANSNGCRVGNIVATSSQSEYDTASAASQQAFLEMRQRGEDSCPYRRRP